MDMSAAFIAYRHKPDKWLARLLYHALSASGYDIFLNTDDTGKFEEMSLRQIAARPHFILLLEPRSLERCADPTDWLRREIEQALATRRNIIPVTVGPFSFSEEKRYLTGTIAQIMSYPPLTLDYILFDEAVEQLRHILARPFRAALTPAPAHEQAIVAHLAQAAQLTFQPSDYHLTIMVPALNIRFGPGMNYPQISAIREGRQPPIIGRNHDNSWWFIEHRGVYGWVTGQFVEVQADADLSRIPVLD
jgi:hypothetical protein